MGEFSYWFYSEMPRFIIRVGRGYVRQAYFGFSVPYLWLTMFAPWKRDIQSTIGVPLMGQFRIWGENIISRLVGIVIRILTIFLGLTIAFFETLYFVVFFALWIMLPLLVVALLAYGIRILTAGVL